MASQHSQKGATLTRLILEIFRVNGRLLIEGDRLVIPFGQTSSRWQVLGAVEDEPATVPMIGRLMGISRQSVQRTADILVNDGLCEFVDNPHHQKSPLLTLTEKGAKLLKKISRVQIEWSNRLAATLDKDELENSVSVLAALDQALASTLP